MVWRFSLDVANRSQDKAIFFWPTLLTRWTLPC